MSPVALRELVESLVLADEVRVRVDVVPELYEIFIGTVDTIVGDIPLMEITRSHRCRATTRRQARDRHRRSRWSCSCC